MQSEGDDLRRSLDDDEIAFRRLQADFRGFLVFRRMVAGERRLVVEVVGAVDPGVEVVGILPREISTPTGLVGFIHSKAKSPAAAKALLDYLSSAEAAKVYRETGMQPGR